MLLPRQIKNSLHFCIGNQISAWFSLIGQNYIKTISLKLKKHIKLNSLPEDITGVVRLMEEAVTAVPLPVST